MNRIGWTHRFANVTADSGDKLELEYFDYFFPQTYWEPAEYEVEYHNLKINGVDYADDIEEFLESLSERDRSALERSAEVAIVEPNFPPD